VSARHESGRLVTAPPPAPRAAAASREPIEPQGGVESAIAAALELAWGSMRAERISDAAAICDSLLDLRPDHPETLYLFASLLHRMERRRSALAVIDQAIAGRADHPARWTAHKCLLLIETGHAEEAARTCRERLAGQTDDADLLGVLGLALMAVGKSKPAIAAFRRAIARPDANPGLQGELARALMSEARFGEAATAYATALYRGGQPMRGRHIGCFRPSTVKRWCAGHSALYRVILAGRTGRTFKPRYDGQPGICDPEPLLQPEVYLAEIPDAAVIGGLGAILTGDDTVLLDAAFVAGAARHDLVQPAMPYADGGGVLIDASGVAPEPIETGILLQGPSGTNYYHWVVEHLSKLHVLELAGVPAGIPLLVSASVLAVPQLAEALGAADSAHRRVVPLTPGIEYKVSRLIVPGSLCWAASNLRDHLRLEVGDNLVAREAVQFLRSRLAIRTAPQSAGRRLYITRRARTSGVRLVNEEAVRGMFIDLGFEAVGTDTMTFDEQRAMFSQASIVAGESGAALTNMLFAPDSAVLVCLQAEQWPMNVYADLVGHAGQASIFIAGAVESEQNPKPYQVRFSIDVDALRQAMVGFLESMGTSARPGHELERE
jgi:capsular polysaccharide biosynthesis protein